jgi:hypothetical protein
LNTFQDIDNKLIAFADKHNARLTKDRNGFFPIERRIDWIENQIRKAIIIQPAFLMTPNADSSLWNFINVAWIMQNGVAVKPGWMKILLEKSDFNLIDKDIDELLFQSENNLCNIKLEDVE